MKQNKSWILSIIFLIAVFVRFYSIKSNIYFGFDEARDALVSESIYLNRDFKLIGPPATGDTGLFHGPAFWYLIGPLYILFKGNLYIMSALFGAINALGIFLVYGIAKKLFSERVGYLSAFLFAISFEQSQYSLYVGKESLALICWLTIIYFLVAIYKKEKLGLVYGPLVISFLYGLMLQFNIIYAGYSLGLIAMAIILFPQLKLIQKKSWFLAITTFVITLSTYILAEFKYNFRETRTAINLIHSGFGIMSEGESKYTLYWNKYLTMFRDNVVGLSFDISAQKMVIILLTVAFTVWLVIKSVKDKRFALLLVWLMTWVGVMLAGGHMAYYTNVATSVSILICVATIIEGTNHKNIVYGLLVLIIVFSNLLLIRSRIGKGLIPAIKPQPYMNLIDERKIIEQMYSDAQGKGFTLRLTGIPYKIQTVWYYLLREYGYKKYGYFPYWEHGNIAGYPGVLPVPSHGTTCLRFLVREPMTGLPLDLVALDEKEENYYSTIKTIKGIGQFTIQERIAIGNDCHNQVPLVK